MTSSDCRYQTVKYSVEVAWLMGDQAPFIDDEVDFASDSLGIKVRHAFGAGVGDWVGAQWNVGA